MFETVPKNKMHRKDARRNTEPKEMWEMDKMILRFYCHVMVATCSLYIKAMLDWYYFSNMHNNIVRNHINGNMPRIWKCMLNRVYILVYVTSIVCIRVESEHANETFNLFHFCITKFFLLEKPMKELERGTTYAINREDICFLVFVAELTY